MALPLAIGSLCCIIPSSCKIPITTSFDHAKTLHPLFLWRTADPVTPLTPKVAAPCLSRRWPRCRLSPRIAARVYEEHAGCLGRSFTPHVHDVHDVHGTSPC